jgi:hypothetical protein
MPSVSRPFRNKDQSMGLVLHEPLVRDFSRIDRAVAAMAEGGYDILRVFVRCTNFNHRNPAMIAAIAHLTEESHRLGMRVALDCEPNEILCPDMGGEFPAAIGCRLVRFSTRLVDGHFLLHLRTPRHAAYAGIEAAFLQQDGRVRRIDFPFIASVAPERYAAGYTRAESSYVEGRATDFHVVCRLAGQLTESSGELIVYARFSTLQMVDFWSEDFHRYHQSLLECYRDIPLDGIGWDEPARAPDWNGYKSGEGFSRAFAKRNGYELADRLYLLDEPGTSPEAVRVRMDYYRTLNEGLYEAQRRMIATARKLFGHDLLLGTHHTWHGEGNITDLRAGAVDYFRLNENMDAGYTDCFCVDWPSVCYMYTFASSLARLTPSGEAEVNSLYETVTNSQVEFQARFLTLFDINWYNGWAGEANDHKYYPGHYTWATTIEATRRHRDCQRLLGRAVPVNDLAIWHGWEGIAAVNRADIASAQKAFCINISTVMVERNLSFDWIDSGLLEKGTVENGWLKTALNRYRTVVLPYANTMPRAAWKKCLEFAQRGGRLIFIGTPPDRDTDGEALADEFATLLEAPAPPLERYLEWMASTCTLPPNRPERLDVTFPLTGPSDQLLISKEGESHGLRSRDGRIVYLSDLDPRERLLPFLAAAGPSPEFPSLAIFSADILGRLYRRKNASEGEYVLILIARQNCELRGVIEIGEHRFKLTAGTVAFAFLNSAGIEVQGDGVVWQNLATATQG